MLVDCKYKENCAGCSHLGTTLEVQHALKRKDLLELLREAELPYDAEIKVLSPAASGLRDRVDFVVEEGRLGLYGKTSREVVDIEECSQLSSALQSWLTEVRKVVFPVRKGSVRLRVGPHGLRGIWLDFANVDIKNILDEKTWLTQLQTMAFVEIGQRHKVPRMENGVFKLRDTEPQVWFQTSNGSHAVDLYSTIASFTQPGFEANRWIVREIDAWLNASNAKHVLEFGSGIGNLSFAALGKDRHLTACEIDERSLEGFNKSLLTLSKEEEFKNIQNRVEILRGDFQNKNPQDFGNFDTVLANPPRSGLKQFLKPLLNAGLKKPKAFIYMSCYPKSFAEDGKQLKEAGYQLAEVKILDQFPQTAHYEVLGLWKLQGSC